VSAAVTRAYTETRSTRSASAASSSFSSSVPVKTWSPGVRIPSSAAIARAVFGWSPVIITVRIPAR
jgi:hypothetical protein